MQRASGRPDETNGAKRHLLGVARTLAFAIVGSLVGGCIDIPNPLAPQLSGSIGVPHHGVITGAVPIPKKGNGYALFREDDGVRYGLQRLVDTITTAASEVKRQSPGLPPLVVGDLSERFGGHSERHSSHRSGRDADLLYFVMTPDGVPVRSPGFVRFGPDGLAETDSKGKFVRLDLARNWLLIKTLLTSPHSEVQWIFMSRPIEGLITEYARAVGEDPELIWYAETVMQQPSDSAVHDDHMHLRIACTPDESVTGCAGGPRWPFNTPLPKLEITEAEELSALLGNP
jgi:penicillin-insensitive murein DD-endopeptidase